MIGGHHESHPAFFFCPAVKTQIQRDLVCITPP